MDDMEQVSHSGAVKDDDIQPLPSRKGKAPLLLSWSPYAIAGCLMILGISQTQQILALKAQLQAARGDVARLKQSNAYAGLRLTTLDARDASYASTRVLVAWDPYQNQGVASLQNLPAAPAGITSCGYWIRRRRLPSTPG